MSGSGVFLQTDPEPGGSANPYDYCNADPINCVDLSGTEAVEMGEGGGEAELVAEALDNPAGEDFLEYLAEHPEEASAGDFGDLYTSNKALQHMFSSEGNHPGDFGVQGTWNKANGNALKNALNEFYDGAQKRYGWYRNKPAMFAYNTSTNQVIITNRVGDLISGWRFSDRQMWYLINTGRVN